MRANRIVRVHVLELNHAIRCHQEHSRNRQLMVFFSGGSLEIDSMLREKLQRCIIDLIRNPEGSRRGHLAVREEKEFEVVFLYCLAHVGWLVW